MQSGADFATTSRLDFLDVAPRQTRSVGVVEHRFQTYNMHELYRTKYRKSGTYILDY